MISFPNAKINLGLHVLEKRKDGFHNIESCFYPMELCDALEVMPANQLHFESTGLPIPGNTSDNLVLRAYHLLSRFHDLPNVAIHLHKVIPMGAGLGGGSSDGAFALKMLNELFQIGLTNIQVKALAAELGSDCPFFLKNEPSIATGTGTSLEPIDLDLKGYRIELLYPDVHVSTGQAYALIKPKKKRLSVREILVLPISQWQDKLINDFEDPMIAKYPQIGEAKKQLLEKGAVYASMTGSGSTVFGLFEK